MFSSITWLFKQPRSIKRIISVVLDIVFITSAFWGAYILRLENLELLSSAKHWGMLAAILPVTILCFIRLGLYRAVLRYLSHQAITTVLISIAVSVAAMVISAHYLHAFLPRSVPVLYAAFVLILCGGARLSVRALYNQSTKRQKIPVIIYGAGSSGRQLNTSLLHGNEYRAVAFVDDNSVFVNSVLQGLTVYSPSELAWLTERFGAQKILLAVPSLTRQRRREIIESLALLPLEVLTIPGMADIVSGMAKVSELQEVSIDDLLGRDPVEPYTDLIAANITNKVVMVTGAGGSIGSELCRQILQQRPTILVLFEMSEFALYQIDQELSGICNTTALNVRVIPLMGSVQRQNRLEAAMHAYSVQTVYHAAACKHVPLVEYNVVEGVRNNVFGTWRAAEAAINTGVETFVLISTDKAVRPSNVMGTSKRLAELVLQGLAQRQSSTRFCMVRFGNVLGSSGSVVPLFKKQIKAGGPITLTHKDITRYFMTIPEAAQLVIQAGALGQGGDVFVLDMGEPVRIIDLATKMVRLMGYDVKSLAIPAGDIEIKVTGLRPGEKLYEELLIGGDEQPTLHPRIRTAHEVSLPWDQMAAYLARLNIACEVYDQAEIRALLLEAPVAFSPQAGICDLLWVENN
ncbi:polysaccharide biosynthesis protein [Neptunomonas antarctica]|uniref:NDP-sugar epimerase, includes UDP-GlcNAc-inverting 4,6-dehydratase FlaA1 and capsular polysaccharide biosynthesis protein EpsC n=1 Tax=Neptunomonas antarctica TaxID=619304 RepID=A0A1N7JDN5_9GAMM|nr:nucleoside-diphosphate sugar epimerase/dehydratase [Neptunomonas antarctica]SIS47361.1 NDP-sugar epimerase, includes UDP-GlcNAc-inverting 4,6-dehydratase FlaA1 and capsular polysaccharide biosynthesis protein EpsC [Neptunomonas antarctica]